MIMITSTLLFFLGTAPESIVIARAIQGASTTFVWVSGTAFLVSQVGEGDLGEYVGWMTVGIAAGEVAGPLLGGPIYDNLGHWAAFAIVQALLVVDILLRLFVKSGKVESEGKAGNEEDPETGELLQGGQENSSGYDTTQSEATESDSMNSVMRGLAWNWLGTVFAMVAIFTIRGALEVVCRSTSMLSNSCADLEVHSAVCYTAVFVDPDQDRPGLVDLALAGSIKPDGRKVRLALWT